jgi:hypothetical protein
MSTGLLTSLFRMPPFPGSQPRPFLRAGASEPLSDAELDKAALAAARLKVGGTFWAAQPPLPGAGYRLVRVSSSDGRSCAQR